MEKNEKRYAKLLRDMEPIYDRFLAETPSIGGKKNPMSVNTDMALPFLRYMRRRGEAFPPKSSTRCWML